MSIPIAPSVLVKHVIWGYGKVVEVASPHVVIYFPSLANDPNGPKRKLSVTAHQLCVPDNQAEADITVPTAKSAPGGRRLKVLKPTLHSLEQTISWFEKAYPQRFDDPGLIDMELGYKRAAHQSFEEHFGNGRGKALLDAHDHSTISRALAQLYNATNIPSRFEVMAATDGLKDERAAARLLGSILEFVDWPHSESFASLADAVLSLPKPAKGSRALTWPNVTIIPFLADPKRFMVLKPEVTERIARRVEFDLLYTSSPTWRTYEALLQLSTLLLDRLASLGAKDFIDVQSFIWVTQDLE